MELQQIDVSRFESSQLESACFSADPEGKILIFYGSFGAIANFAMVPKFEESAKKSTRELVKRVLLASFARNSG